MSPSELARRLSALDWSMTPLQNQLAISAAVTSLSEGRPQPTDPAQPCGETKPDRVAFHIYHNVVALPVPTLQRTMKHVTLLHLDGTQFTTAGFLPGDAGAPWAWICETVAAECGCGEDAVGCLEPPEDEGGGDFVTVDGLPVYRVAIGRNAAGGPRDMQTPDGPVGCS